MTVFIQISKDGGMLFNSRRVSRDGVISEKIADFANHKLYIDPKSKIIFNEDDVIISENPLDECPENGFCFNEFSELLPYLNKITKLIVINWNRDYPSDFSLDLIPCDNGFSLERSEIIVGNSHDEIIWEEWVK